MTAKCVYSFLVSENRGDRHCVEKFLPLYGVLYWPTTWRQLFFFDLDRPVIDLCWKIAQGVLYTADRLIGFGYSIDPSCFCGLASERLPHCFFLVLWLKVPCLGSSPRCFVFLLCLLLWFVVMFCLALVRMRFVPFPVFLWRFGKVVKEKSLS